MFVWASFPQSESFQQTFTFLEQDSSIFDFNVFILLVTRLLKNNPFQTIFLLQKAVRKGHTFSFFLLCPKYVFYFTAHKCLKKYHLYIHFYIIVSVLHQPIHVTFSTCPSFVYTFRIFSLSTHSIC